MSAPLRRYLRRMWRAQLTEGALLTLHEAAEALPGDPRLATGWIAENVEPAGRWLDQPVYRWGDVAAAMAPASGASGPDAGGTWISTVQAAERLGVSRSTLDAMVARAPPGLPGAPTCVGDGGRRQHLRWDPAGLAAWMSALQESEAKRPPTAPRVPRRPRPARPPGTEDGPVDWAAVGRTARGR